MTFALGHRPALDGLRGVAVLMVMLCHVDVEWFSAKGGFIGVHFFFVLSGFLITSLLLEEHWNTGRIRLGAFYARRALRLLPAIFLLLLVVWIAAAVFGSQKDFRDVSASVPMVLFYVANWFVGAGSFPDEYFLGHCWSLAVEEQFYLVWPLVLIGLLKLVTRRGLVLVTGVAFVAAACWRAYLWLSRLDANRIYFGSDTNADALLAGVFIAALVTQWKPTKVKALHVAGVLIALLIPVAMFKLIHYGKVVWWLYAGGLPVIEALVAVLILALLFTPLRTLFEARWLVWIGKVSYGLYLWHIPTLAWSRRALPVGWSELVGVAATFAITAVSFYAMEKPILRFKERFTIPNVR